MSRTGVVASSHEDKTTWVPGPWKDEPDRVEWRYHGLPALLHRSPTTGAWCGYVGVSEGHPWFSCRFSELSESVDVHGGLNYAEPCSGRICHVPREGESDHVYWVGFECGHAFDFMPKMDARLRELGMRSDLPEFNVDASSEDEWCRVKYRDMAYAMAETERLADQAIAATYPGRDARQHDSEQ